MQQLELLEQSDQAVKNLSRQLTQSIDENRQYRHISNHSLQEPLRKLRLFSGMLADAAKRKENDKTEWLAEKINIGAEKFSKMIKDLADFSVLDDDTFIELTDLNDILAVVCSQVSPQLKAKKASVHTDPLPSLKAVSLQMEQLFLPLTSQRH